MKEETFQVKRERDPGFDFSKPARKTALLCTNGFQNADIHDATAMKEYFERNFAKDYPATPLQPVSTIGAGDNFNAGIIFGLLEQNVGLETLNETDEATWDAIVRRGMEFAADVCLSFSNSVSPQFAAAHRYAPRP